MNLDLSNTGGEPFFHYLQTHLIRLTVQSLATDNFRGSLDHRDPIRPQPSNEASSRVTETASGADPGTRCTNTSSSTTLSGSTSNSRSGPIYRSRTSPKFVKIIPDKLC